MKLKLREAQSQEMMTWKFRTKVKTKFAKVAHVYVLCNDERIYQLIALWE